MQSNAVRVQCNGKHTTMHANQDDFHLTRRKTFFALCHFQGCMHTQVTPTDLSARASHISPWLGHMAHGDFPHKTCSNSSNPIINQPRAEGIDEYLLT